jgi:hypothetical protein
MIKTKYNVLEAANDLLKGVSPAFSSTNLQMVIDPLSKNVVIFNANTNTKETFGQYLSKLAYGGILEEKWLIEYPVISTIQLINYYKNHPNNDIVVKFKWTGYDSPEMVEAVTDFKYDNTNWNDFESIVYAILEDGWTEPLEQILLEGSWVINDRGLKEANINEES